MYVNRTNSTVPKSSLILNDNTGREEKAGKENKDKAIIFNIMDTNILLGQ